MRRSTEGRPHNNQPRAEFIGSGITKGEEMKKCRVCKDKTKDYKKINKLKIYLCTEACEITYVLKRFLNSKYNYNQHYGNVFKNLNS